MGVIKDIVDKVVPRVQTRIEDKGIGIKEALFIEFKALGYIPEKESWNKNDTKKGTESNGCSETRET